MKCGQKRRAKEAKEAKKTLLAGLRAELTGKMLALYLSLPLGSAAADQNDIKAAIGAIADITDPGEIRRCLQEVDRLAAIPEGRARALSFLSILWMLRMASCSYQHYRDNLDASVRIYIDEARMPPPYYVKDQAQSSRPPQKL